MKIRAAFVLQRAQDAAETTNSIELSEGDRGRITQNPKRFSMDKSYIS